MSKNEKLATSFNSRIVSLEQKKCFMESLARETRRGMAVPIFVSIQQHQHAPCVYVNHQGESSAVDGRVKSALRRTAKNDAESWTVGVGKQSLKPKRNWFLTSDSRGTENGGKNEKDGEGREKGVINFNLWFLCRSLSATRQPDWYDKSPLHHEVEIFIGLEPSSATRIRDGCVIYSGFYERNYKKKKRKKRTTLDVIANEIYERSAIAKTLINIYEY